MASLKLDFKERLMLANQYKILEALYPDEAASYAKARNAVENGYEIAYGWHVQHIDPEPMSEAAGKEVLDILGMYERLSYSYEQLADKSGIEARAVKFPGFDGNNEGSQLGFAKFLHDEGKFQDCPPINSHMPTLETYRRMLSAYQKVQSKQEWTKEDIQKILAERIHPSHR